MKILPLLSKRLNLRVARITTQNGGAISSTKEKWKESPQFSQYLRSKYIDT